MGDPDHHLTLYRLEYPDQPQSWLVEVKNQFGESQQLTVAGPFWLAVPTQKGDHEEPQCLDHFLVYGVTSGPSLETSVMLVDEFRQETVTVWEPKMFANPVQKTHEDTIVEIQNPDDHLVFYEITGEPYETTVNIDNQFGEQALELTNPALLAVPSEKLDWAEQIDHFKCYSLVESPPAEEVVGLKDQFVDISATVMSPFLFCNPAQKLLEPIVDEDHHLTIYGLADVVPQEWFVQVHNQFGPQGLTVSGPVALAVPSQKLFPYPHEAPVGLDHYLLYAVTEGTALEIPVSLTDEFGIDPAVMVMGPAFFAIPVQKTHETTVIEIENSMAHLVFYKIIGGTVSVPLVTVDNQFCEVPAEYSVIGPDMLAVPSLKLVVDPIG